MLPQILPGVLDTIRLNLKAIIIFLIAGEALGRLPSAWATGSTSSGATSRWTSSFPTSSG